MSTVNHQQARRRVRNLVTAIFCLLPFSAQAQNWSFLHGFGSGIMAIHFLDGLGMPRTGFVGLEDGRVFRTTDGGQSWQQTTTPDMHGPVNCFTFKDPLTGWYSCRQALHSGCYRTTDGGFTWTPLAPMDNRFSVYYNPSNKRLFLTGYYTGFLTSTNDGDTWTRGGPDLNGIAFSNGLLGVITCFGGHNVFTNDGGLTWLPGRNMAECWNPLAIPSTPIFFAISEGARYAMRTTDGGNYWTNRAAIIDTPTGDVRGTCSQLYMQTRRGMLYSNDEGITWKDLGGPGNQADTRFYVVKDIVYAGDENGRLFLLRDSVRAPVGKIQVSGGYPNIYTRNCRGTDTSFLLLPLNACLPTTIVSVDTVGTPGLLLRDSASLFPKKLEAGDTCRVHVIYRPYGNDDSLRITVHYKLGDFPYDSTFTIYGRRDPTISLSVLGEPVKLLAPTPCREVKAAFSILNSKCDSIEILEIRPLDSLHFGVDRPVLPTVIPPYGNISVTVFASGETKDTIYTSLIVRARLRGNEQEISVSAILVVLKHAPVAVSMPFLMSTPPTNICARRTLTIPIQNASCSDLICSQPRWITEIPTLTILSQPHFPRVLKPLERDSIVLLYAPDSVKNVTAVLGWHLECDSAQIDTSIQIRTFAYSLSRATLSSSTLEFDSILRCDVTTNSLYIRNESCKPTQLTAILAGRDKSFSVLSPPVLSWIAPGDSVLCLVQETPAGSGVRSDSVELMFRDSSGSEQSLTVALRGVVRPSVRRLALSDTAFTMRGITPCSTADTTLTIVNRGVCDTLVITGAECTGSSWFSVAPRAFPIRLGVGDSLTLTVHVSATSDSTASGAVRISGEGIDTMLTIRAYTAVPKGAHVAAVVNDSVFHSKLCGSDQKSLVLRNLTCGPITVTGLGLNGDPDFTIYPPHADSFVIPAGDTERVTVLFGGNKNVPVAGAVARLHFTTADGSTDRTITLSGFVTTKQQSLRLAICGEGGVRNVRGAVDSVTRLYVMPLDSRADSLGLRQISTDVALDNDLLTFIGGDGMNGWNLNATTSGSQLHLEIASVAPHDVVAALPLAELRFRGTLGPRSASPIALTHTTLNNGDSAFAECVLIAAEDSAIQVSVATGCGDSLLRLELGGLGITVQSVEPLAQGSENSVRIILSAPQSCDLRAALANEQGIVVSAHAFSVSPGTSMLDLPAPLTSGVYFVTLESPFGREVRKVSVVR